jgi:hypothetical protein
VLPELNPQGLLGPERQREYRFELQWIADNHRAAGAPQRANGVLWGCLTGLIDEQPAQRLCSEMSEDPSERREGRRHDWHDEEQALPSGQRGGLSEIARCRSLQDVGGSAQVLPHPEGLVGEEVAMQPEGR